LISRAHPFLRSQLKAPYRVKEIAGDASTRRFYRITSGRRRAVLVIHPEPLHPSSPLYSNHRVMSAIKAPVPRILASDDASGSVLMEDLGDTTLQRHLVGSAGGSKTASRPEKTRLYRQACDIIVLLQRRGAAALRQDDFAAHHALDRERFRFELDHFHQHFVIGWRVRCPSSGDERLLRSFYDFLAESCHRLPRVYCHRDFQSRNLMVTGTGRTGGRRLRLIDFQDARMGPYTYDTASLLRDSSLDLDEPLVDEMLGHLCRRLGAGVEEFRRDFDLMALQRNLKDLGTFGYMATVRGLRAYLDYVPRTIRSVRTALLADRRYDIIYPVLERHVLS
jgi:hypothetical protein